MRKLILLLVTAIGIAVVAIVAMQLNAPPMVPANEFLEFRLAADDTIRDHGFTTEVEVDSEFVTGVPQNLLYLDDEVVITGKDIVDVTHEIGPEGESIIGFELTEPAAARMKQSTKRAMSLSNPISGAYCRMAVLFDGQVLYAVRIQSEFAGSFAATIPEHESGEDKGGEFWELMTTPRLPLASWGSPIESQIIEDYRHDIYENGRQVLVHPDESFHLLAGDEAVLYTSEGMVVVAANDSRLLEPPPLEKPASASPEEQITTTEVQEKPSVLSTLRPGE